MNLWKKLTSTDKKTAQGWYDRGVKLSIEGKSEESVQAFLHADSMKPDDLALSFAISEALYLAQREEEALVGFKRLIVEDCGMIAAHKRIAQIYLEKGRSKEATASLEAALYLDGNDLETWLLLASAAQKSHDQVKCIKVLEDIAERWPENVAVHERLGRALEEGERYEDALAAWEKSHKFGDPKLEVMSALGRLYSKLGRHEESLSILEACNTSFPGEVLVLATLGRALLEAGRAADACEVFHDAQRIDPSVGDIHRLWGLAYKASGRKSQAIVCFQKAAVLSPESVEAFHELAQAFFEQGDLVAARAAAIQAAAMAPGLAEIQNLLDAIIRTPQQEHTEPQEEKKSAQHKTTMTGTLEAFSLPDLLEFLRVHRATGSLVIAGEPGAALIQLREGEITKAEAPGVERLGERMVTEKKITNDDLVLALSEQKKSKSSRRLGSVLVNLGVLERSALEESWRKQALAALSETLGWKGGDFSFQAMQDQGEESTDLLSLGIQEALFEVMVAIDEKSTEEAQDDNHSSEGERTKEAPGLEDEALEALHPTPEEALDPRPDHAEQHWAAEPEPEPGHRNVDQSETPSTVHATPKTNTSEPVPTAEEVVAVEKDAAVPGETAIPDPNQLSSGPRA